MASPFRHWLEYALISLIFRIARPLPRRWLLAWGRALGSFVWHVVRFRRNIVLDNIRTSLPELETEARVQEVARSFYRNLGMTLMEFLALPNMSREELLDVVDIQGQANLEKVLEGGRGGLLVSGHFGNWELLGARAAATGHKVNFIVKSQANPRVDQLQNDIRAQVGLGIIRSGGAIKEMIKALRECQFIGLLADQDAGPDGIFTEFLGRQASVFKGTAYLAWKLKCPVVTGHILRQPDGRHLCVVEEPIFLDPEIGEEEAVQMLTEIHVQRLADAIRKAPDQYYWFHRRWKTRPPEEIS